MTCVELFNGIIEHLPRQPRSYDTNEDPGFWTNGDEILCPSETECEILTAFLEDVFSEYPDRPTILTGYYDPFEDAENAEQDDCTGFNYIRIE